MSPRDEFDAASRKFVDDFRRGDADACANAYTLDVIYCAPGMATVHGRAALREAFADAIKDGYVVTRLHTHKADFDGNLGYAIQYVSTATGADEIVLLALRREEETWKIAAEAVVLK